jgi:hypothetical protein
MSTTPEAAVKERSAEKPREILIKAPAFEYLLTEIIGTAPYVSNKFSSEALAMMRAKQEKGHQGKKGGARKPKDFEANYKETMHTSKEGWHGIPATSFRNAMISACRLIGFKMTLAKMAVFVEGEGLDAQEGTPLVRILDGEPRKHEGFVRLATGVADIKAAAMWETWRCKLRVRYDSDIFSSEDVANLLMRAGQQVGVGRGRPDSTQSAGMGWGTFRIMENANG